MAAYFIVTAAVLGLLALGVIGEALAILFGYIDPWERR